MDWTTRKQKIITIVQLSYRSRSCEVRKNDMTGEQENTIILSRDDDR